MSQANKKPLITKTAESKIRSKQRKVVLCRDALIYDEIEIGRLNSRISEYESSPEAFTEKYYPNCGGPSSYPVTVNIQRAKEKLAYLISRYSDNQVALANAEIELAKVEEGAINAVSAGNARSVMGVPFPDPLIGFDDYRKAMIDEASAEDELLESELIKDRRCAENEKSDFLARERFLDEQAEKKWQESLLRMSPDEAAFEIAGMKALREAFASKKIGLADISEWVNSRKL